MKLKSNQLLISDDGGIIMGNERMEILDLIDQTGSINQASKK
jgi:molybdenum-dependent DNA-binding transcriptional regulator ModE